VGAVKLVHLPPPNLMRCATAPGDKGRDPLKLSSARYLSAFAGVLV
jgi:hypothetical protein